MDMFFLSERLLTIAKYRHSSILFKKEKLYYYRYMLKLNYNLEYLETKEVKSALNYIDKFERKEYNRIKNGFFIKPRKVLSLVCADARDVVESMQRYEGVLFPCPKS